MDKKIEIGNGQHLYASRFKPGDTVYVLAGGFVFSYECMGIIFSRGRLHQDGTIHLEMFADPRMSTFGEEDCFHTRAEAETAKADRSIALFKKLDEMSERLDGQETTR